MNRLKWIGIGITILIVAGITYFAYSQYKARQLAEAKLSLINHPVTTNTEAIKIYTDTLGQKHIVIAGDANKVAQSSIKAIGEGTVKLLDSVALALNLSIGDREKITQLTKVITETTGQNIVLKRQVDSLKGKVNILYFYKDKYLNLAVHKSDTSDNMIADYKFNDDINYVDYMKRKWFLGVKRPYTDLYSNNPNTTIKGVNRLTIEHPLSEFGLRLKASSEYNINNKNFSLGPGIEVDLGSKIDASFYMFRTTSSSLWSPVIKLDYNLINL